MWPRAGAQNFRPLTWTQQTSKASRGPRTGHGHLFRTGDSVSAPDWHEIHFKSEHANGAIQTDVCQTRTTDVRGWVWNARVLPAGTARRPAASLSVTTQGTSLCTVRKYIHLSGTESPRQGATWAHSPARLPGWHNPGHVQHRGIGRLRLAGS